MPYYQICTGIHDDEHEPFMEWWIENGKPKRMQDHSTDKPCQFCKLTVRHNTYPLFSEKTGRLAAFMCEADIQFPTRGH